MPKGVYKRKPMNERIMESIEICSITGCWLWKLRLDKDGYGQVSDECKTRHSHKVAYEIFRGSIPEGMVCSHLCDSKYPIDNKDYRRCCNPDHIEITSPSQNSKRMKDLGRVVTSSGAFKKGDTAGEKNNTTKLTRIQVIEILTRTKEHQYGDLKALASEYGIQYQTLYKIMKGKTWIDVYTEFYKST